MPSQKDKIAVALGAKVVGRVPEVGPGAFGAIRLPHLAATLTQRLQPSRGVRPGRPTSRTWDRRSKIPMSAATERKLKQLAKKSSTPRRKVSPMQVAAQLLEAAVASVTR